MQLEDFELEQWTGALQDGNFEFADIDGHAWGLHLFFSLYFFEHPTMEKRERIYELCERFQSLTGNQLKLIYFGRGAAQKLGSHYGQIRGKKENNDKDETFFLKLASTDTAEDSSQYYFDSKVAADGQQSRWNLDFNQYSYLRISVPAEWFNGQQKQALLKMLCEAAEHLDAQQGYGGYGWALPMSHHAYPDFEATEHHFAHEFYGLDIDKPFYMCSGHAQTWSLEKGLRAPSWLTLVGDDWLGKLGGAAVVTGRLLAHPEVWVQSYAGGIIIQAGDSPQLYPVDDGVPEVMMHIAEILKPVRAPTLNLLSYARFDGDQEIGHVFFDLNKCARWLGRYDRDSDWPSVERRKLRPAAAAAASVLTAYPGEPCPETGNWFAHQLTAKTISVEKGQPMPGPEFSATGKVIWHLKREK